MDSIQAAGAQELTPHPANNNKNTTSHAPSSFILPSELWLQILGIDSLSPTHITDLWCNVRPTSRLYKAYVEHIVTTTYLPTIYLSLRLPRYDPNTGLLIHIRPVPDAEVMLQAVRVEGDVLHISTLPLTRKGFSIDYLTQEGFLDKRRLDTATSVWMWFGQNRGKGRQAKMPIDVEWDDQDKVWRARVEWKKLLGSYCQQGRKRRVYGARR